MRISQINPDWFWQKWDKTVVRGGQVIKYASAVKYFPQYEMPFLHRRLEEQFSATVGEAISKEFFITQWLSEFGPLTNTGLQLFRTDELLDEARHVWWIVGVLDVFKQNELNPQEVSLLEAERRLIEVTNPLIGMSELDKGLIEAKYKNVDQLMKSFSLFQGQGEYEWPVVRLAARFLSPTDAKWTVSYSTLLDSVVGTINHYLALNTFVQNQHPQDFPRDASGKKISFNAPPYETINHRITTVLQPRNLSGYIWIRIQEQFEATSFSASK